MPSVTVHHGDSRDVLKTLDANSIDSVATDPPYALVSIVKRFGAEGAAPAQGGVYARAAAGFMGQAWDTGETAFDPAFWAEVFRVMKPGAHLAAFGGTRTYHRLVCAIEDAGFEIRDSLAWIFGSGFPKSHDVAKSIDKAGRGVPHGGADPTSPNHGKFKGGCSGENETGRGFGAGPGQFMASKGGRIEREYSPEAAQWKGWGTALKPAHEPIVLARKPLEGTVAANVMKWGAGGLNIDGCRVDGGSTLRLKSGGRNDFPHEDDAWTPGAVMVGSDKGRWPANVVHDGSPEVIAAFPQTASGGYPPEGGQRTQAAVYGKPNARGEQLFASSDGSAARFFYSAKADSLARLGGKHPTVKPTDLMRWLVTLITPPGGVVLDPFAGSGSTAIGAIAAGFDSVMIEREAEYAQHIRERVAWAQGQGALTSGLTTRNKPKAALDGLLGLMAED